MSASREYFRLPVRNVTIVPDGYPVSFSLSGGLASATSTARLIFDVAITAATARRFDLGASLRVRVLGGDKAQRRPCRPAPSAFGGIADEATTAVYSCGGAYGTVLELSAAIVVKPGSRLEPIVVQSIELLGDVSGNVDPRMEGGGLAAHRLSHLYRNLCGKGWREYNINVPQYCTQEIDRFKLSGLAQDDYRQCRGYGARPWYPRTAEESSYGTSSNFHVSQLGVSFQSGGHPYVAQDGTVLTQEWSEAPTLEEAAKGPKSSSPYSLKFASGGNILVDDADSTAQGLMCARRTLQPISSSIATIRLPEVAELPAADGSPAVHCSAPWALSDSYDNHERCLALGSDLLEIDSAGDSMRAPALSFSWPFAAR